MVELFEDRVLLWNQAMRDPKPLFRTIAVDPLRAVFDQRGFFLSSEAEWAYNKKVHIDRQTLRLKNLPHIYIARKKSENDIYVGISNQKGGRWKRSHAYHLGTLAHEILGTIRYDDQHHSKWIEAWFDVADVRVEQDTFFTVPMKEEIVISFWMFDQTARRNVLLKLESLLISEASARGLRVLNVKK